MHMENKCKGTTYYFSIEHQNRFETKRNHQHRTSQTERISAGHQNKLETKRNQPRDAKTDIIKWRLLAFQCGAESMPISK